MCLFTIGDFRTRVNRGLVTSQEFFSFRFSRFQRVFHEHCDICSFWRVPPRRSV